MSASRFPALSSNFQSYNQFIRSLLSHPSPVFFFFFFSITTFPWPSIVKTHIKDKTIWMNKGSCTLNLLSRSFSSHHSITTFAPHNSLLDPKPYLLQSSICIWNRQAHTLSTERPPPLLIGQSIPPDPPLILIPLSLTFWTVERKVNIDRCHRPGEQRTSKERRLIMILELNGSQLKQSSGL